MFSCWSYFGLECHVGVREAAYVTDALAAVAAEEDAEESGRHRR